MLAGLARTASAQEAPPSTSVNRAESVTVFLAGSAVAFGARRRPPVLRPAVRRGSGSRSRFHGIRSSPSRSTVSRRQGSSSVGGVHCSACGQRMAAHAAARAASHTPIREAFSPSTCSRRSAMPAPRSRAPVRPSRTARYCDIRWHRRAVGRRDDPRAGRPRLVAMPFTPMRSGRRGRPAPRRWDGAAGAEVAAIRCEGQGRTSWCLRARPCRRRGRSRATRPCGCGAGGRWLRSRRCRRGARGGGSGRAGCPEVGIFPCFPASQDQNRADWATASVSTDGGRTGSSPDLWSEVRSLSVTFLIPTMRLSGSSSVVRSTSGTGGATGSRSPYSRGADDVHGIDRGRSRAGAHEAEFTV